MRRAIIVISVNTRTASTAIAELIDRDGGDRTFTNGLVRQETTRPVTHRWCSWWMRDEHYDLLASRFGADHFFDGATWDAEAVLEHLGLVRQPMLEPPVISFTSDLSGP